MDPLILSGVLCARVCHDLAGSIGALAGMLDMCAEDAAQDREALEIARHCAQELVARLKLLRTAWACDGGASESGGGLTHIEGSNSGLEEYALDFDTLSAGLPGASRLCIDVAAYSQSPIPGAGQLLASLLLVAASALPRGGQIRVHGAGLTFNVEIKGVRAGWPDIPDRSDGPSTAGLTPRNVGVAVAWLQARALGRTLRLASPLNLEIA